MKHSQRYLWKHPLELSNLGGMSGILYVGWFLVIPPSFLLHQLALSYATWAAGAPMTVVDKK